LHFAPIHRLLFGMQADLRAALAEAFGSRVTVTPVGGGDAMRQRVAAPAAGTQVLGLIEPGRGCSVIEIVDPPSPLAVGTLQPLLDRLLQQGGATQIDYVHGDDVIERLGQARRQHRLSRAGAGQARTADPRGARRPAAAQDLLDGRSAREALLRRGAAHPLIRPAGPALPSTARAACA
jgi:hypothetical protein